VSVVTIGVDIGGTTGVAIVRDSKLLHSTVRKLKGARPERLTHLREFIIENIKRTRKRAQYKDVDIDIIQYEKPFNMNIKTHATLCMYAGVLEQVADEYGIKVRGIDNRTIKRAMIGRGNATKADMMKHAERLAGKRCVWQDEADAIVIAFYGSE